MLWLLAILTITATPGRWLVTPLESYKEPKTCFQEEERISAEMAKSYPGDTSYQVKCLCITTEGRLCQSLESTNTITESQASS